MNLNIVKSIKNFLSDSRRILSISYKPTSAELNESARIILLGIVLIGLIGFVIAVLVSLFVTGSLALL